MDKILVVEDDKTVYSGIKKLLELQHYSVVIAQNGMEALEKIDESFSLVIMDIMMPQLDGIETCRRMRERYSVPILFLSAKSEELDKLEGLEVGGDDYMTKPFSNMELISKVNALIRRYRVYDSGNANRTNKDDSIETDGLKLFTNRNKVEFNDNEIKLTGKEYEILKLLMKNPDRIYIDVSVDNRKLGPVGELYIGNGSITLLCTGRTWQHNSTSLVKTVFTQNSVTEFTAVAFFESYIKHSMHAC